MNNCEECERLKRDSAAAAHRYYSIRNANGHWWQLYPSWKSYQDDIADARAELEECRQLEKAHEDSHQPTLFQEEQ